MNQNDLRIFQRIGILQNDSATLITDKWGSSVREKVQKMENPVGAGFEL